MKNLWIVAMIGMVMVLAVSRINGNTASDGDGVCITIAPKVLVLDDDNDSPVTVHSNITYSTVDTDSLELKNEEGDSITPTSTFADDQGDLVAKFDREAVEGIVEKGEVTLTLTGTITNDLGETEDFQASYTITVKKEELKARNREKPKS